MNLMSVVVRVFSVPLAVLASGKAQRVFIAIIALNISLQIQKHFLLREDLAELGALGGFQVSLTTISLAGLYGALLIRRGNHSKPLATPGRALIQVTVPATLFLLFCTVSLLAAGDVTLGAFEVVSVLERLLLYLYIAHVMTSRDDVLFLVRALFIGLILQSVLMLAQAGGLLGDLDFYGLKARASFAGDSRVSGTLGSPNTAAAYLGMTMTVAFSVVLSGLRRSDRFFAGLGLALAILPMIFTLSRGGWLSLPVSLTILGFIGVRRIPPKTAAIVVVALIVLVTPFASSVQERLYGDDNGSLAARMPLNHLALAIITDHPLLGVGANNFVVAMQPYLRHFSGNFVYVVHNTYLLVWAETGALGLIAFVWFLVAIIWEGVKAWRLRTSSLALLALGCASAVMCSMIQMTVEPGRGGAAGHFLWVLAGLVTVLNRLSLDTPLSACVPDGTLCGSGIVETLISADKKYVQANIE
jgi:O-antigen ligase